MIPSVKTAEIYKGSIAFIVLQLIMLALVMAFPVLVTGGIQKAESLTSDQIMQQLEMPAAEEPANPAADPAATPASGTPASADPKPADAKEAEADDPMKAMLEEAEKDAKKKKP